MLRTLALLLVASSLGCGLPRASQRAAIETYHAVPEATSVETASPAVNESGSIEEFVQLGLATNPRIVEASQKVDALRHRIPQELSLPDPVVNSTTHLAPIQTAAGEQAFSLGVSQKIVSADRRGTRAAMAIEDVQAAEENLRQAQNELAEKIRQVCYDLLFVRSAMELTREDIQSLKRISEVVVRQYEVNPTVTQQDVLNVQIEQSRVENQLKELSQKEQSYQARLARLTHLSPSSELGIVDDLKAPSTSLNLDSLTDLASSARPELAAQLARVRRDRQKIHLANLQSRPDFTVGLNWVSTSTNGISPVANGDDAVLLGIGFNLPIYQERIRSAASEAMMDSLSSTSRLDSLRDQIAEEIFDLIAKSESTQETLLLLTEDIIPKAERTLNLSIDEFGNGKLEYSELIQDWRALLKYRMAEIRLIADFNRILASLSRAVGSSKPLGIEPDSPQSPRDNVNRDSKSIRETELELASNRRGRIRL